MADQAEQVSTNGLVDTKQQSGAARRRQYPEALKRQMVAETEVPGASVSIVARRHDVNSNQLFKWRRQLLPASSDEGLRSEPELHDPAGAKCERHRQTGSPGSAGGFDRCASTSSRYREGCGARRSPIRHPVSGV